MKSPFDAETAFDLMDPLTCSRRDRVKASLAQTPQLSFLAASPDAASHFRLYHRLVDLQCNMLAFISNAVCR
jgi:hypothetical protein